MRALIGLVAAGAAVYGLALLWLYVVQRRYLYFPGPDPGPPPKGVREVPVCTADGLVLKAWFQPARSPRCGAVLLLHGNGGSRGDLETEMADLAALGLDVLAPDWRGFGGNPGAPDEAGLYRDGEAALATLREVAGVPPAQILLVGFSLGAAVAVELALQVPVRGLVLLGPFTSIPAAAARHFPWAPVSVLVRDRFDILVRAPQVRQPVVVLGGTADELLGPEMSRRVCTAFPRGRFVPVPGAGHNDLFAAGLPELRSAVAGLIRRP